MISVNPAQGIGNYSDIIAAALREAADAAEHESAGDCDLRQPDGCRHTAIDAKGRGAVRIIGRENDMDAVESQARFIHQRRTEDP